jgi:hypothetical protein
MPLQKLGFKPGINRESTTYANEGGWYQGDKIRFRSGQPEKVGGWVRDTGTLSNVIGTTTTTIAYPPTGTLWGVARSLWNWVTLAISNLVSIGTSLKFYIQNGVNGQFFDVTPLRATLAAPAAFARAYSTLSGDITASATTITLANATSFPTVGGKILIDSEQITYTGVSSNTLTGCVRGVNGTVAASHTTATPVGGYTITVTNTTHLAATGDFVTFSGAASLGGNITAAVLNAEFQITYISSSTYAITLSAACNASDTGNGGASTVAAYQITVGGGALVATSGWGTGTWAGEALGITPATGWGQSYSVGANPATNTLRLWSQSNFGENLIFNYRSGPMFYWAVSATPNVFNRGVEIKPSITAASGSASSIATTVLTVGGTVAGTFSVGLILSGVDVVPGTYITSLGTGTGGAGTYNINQTQTVASTVITGTTTVDGAVVDATCPSTIHSIMVSDSSRFVIAFGCNDPTDTYATLALDPMQIRWSDQESFSVWEPAPTNQAGDHRLSHGSNIVAVNQTRQEIVILTDAAIYSMQYLGPPYVWGFQILDDNISIAGPNAVAVANNITYWMGMDKFYMYSGRVQTLPSTLREYVFTDINLSQGYQFNAGTNEGYNEVWWNYCSSNSLVIDRYVIYNYLENSWYYGSWNNIDNVPQGRTVWYDSPLRFSPMSVAYGTASLTGDTNSTLVYQESGVDDGLAVPPVAIHAFIQSSDFDIGEGHNYAFVWRLIPDLTFDGSYVDTPSAYFTLRPRTFPGAAYGTSAIPAVTSTQDYAAQRTYEVQQFTEQVYVRIRGRQMAFKVSSDTLGVQWQLGISRMDIRPDGRRS